MHRYVRRVFAFADIGGAMYCCLGEEILETLHYHVEVLGMAKTAAAEG